MKAGYALRRVFAYECAANKRYYVRVRVLYYSILYNCTDTTRYAGARIGSVKKLGKQMYTC